MSMPVQQVQYQPGEEEKNQEVQHCKRQGKTVCYALSQLQYEAAKQAIATHRRAQAILAKLQALTLERILKKVPGVKKRK